jgi:putative hydroxymethylpyrimidine transport system permease protein
MKMRLIVPTIVYRLFWLILFFVIWELIVRFFSIKSFVLPAPTAIFSEMWNVRDVWWQHIWMTFSEAMIGLLIAVVVAWVLAISMHRYIILEKMMYPMIVASQTIPIMAISPIFIIWFDYTIWSKVAVVVLWTFFPMVISLNDGFRSVSRQQRSMLRSLGATWWQTFRLLELPQALPIFFNGLQMAAAFSVIGATVGEWLGAEQGLGFFARRASNNLQTELLFAAVILLSLMGIGMFYMMKWLGKKIAPWHK